MQRKRFLELTLRTYLGKDYKKYIDQISKKETDYEEADEWKKYLNDEEEVEPPKVHPTRVFLDPNEIISYVETFSMEEAAKNPDNPIYDTVDIHMYDGIQVSIISTLDEFNQKLKDFYNEGAE